MQAVICKGSHHNSDIGPLTLALSRQGRGNKINFLPLDGGGKRWEWLSVETIVRLLIYED
jgi:hypothetical protein